MMMMMMMVVVVMIMMMMMMMMVMVVVVTMMMMMMMMMVVVAVVVVKWQLGYRLMKTVSESLKTVRFYICINLCIRSLFLLPHWMFKILFSFHRGRVAVVVLGQLRASCFPFPMEMSTLGGGKCSA